MRKPHPIRMWAVIIKSHRSEWIHWETVAPTRKGARDRYDTIWSNPGRVQIMLKEGRIRLARVTVVPA